MPAALGMAGLRPVSIVAVAIGTSNVFTQADFATLRRVTNSIRRLPGVHGAESLSNVLRFRHGVCRCVLLGACVGCEQDLMLPQACNTGSFLLAGLTLLLELTLLLTLAGDGAVAGQLALEHGHFAFLRVAPREREARLVVRFAGEPALAEPPDPRCPVASSLRIAPSAEAVERMLECENWSARPGGGYRYRERGPGTRIRIHLRPGVLSASFHSADLLAPNAVGSELEFRLSVGERGYCGRFEPVRRKSRRLALARGPTRPCMELRPRPSFIVINLDDARVDGVDRMPVLKSRLIEQGVSFEHAFTPNATCCPSRASLFSGLYSFNHGTRQSNGVIGGAKIFRRSGADRETFVTWLHEVGYRTGLFGKYLNGYLPADAESLNSDGGMYVPPGWDRWWAMVPAQYGGRHGFAYTVVEEDGRLSDFSDSSSDAEYSTDLSAQLLRDFIRDAVHEGRPFLAYWAPKAPHVEGIGRLFATPADRHLGLFHGLSPWRPPSWAEADVSDKPRWVAAQGDGYPRAVTDLQRRMGYEALLSVDEQLERILDLLAELGIERDTVVLFTSDNGVGWGEHGVFFTKKGCPYEECQRVPLIVRYPRLVRSPRRVSDTAALNLDIAPTLAALAGVAVPVPLDGKSLEGWIRGDESAVPRSDYIIEGFRRLRSDGVSVSGQPTDGDQLRLFYGPPMANPRLAVLFEFDGGAGGVDGGAVRVPIGGTTESTRAWLALQVDQHVPVARALVLAERVLVLDESDQHDGVYWWKERDQSGVLEPDSVRPDHLGVRDVARGYTWVEYETGERELYDLRSDPHQLENRAYDPTYAAAADELAARLDALLEEASEASLAR